jgi:hypothetical protein
MVSSVVSILTSMETLKRLPSYFNDDLPWYRHPNGWGIRKCKRDWSLRGFGERGIAGIDTTASPLYWYEAYAWGRRPRVIVESFNTLREARAWCDENRP